MSQERGGSVLQSTHTGGPASCHVMVRFLPSMPSCPTAGGAVAWADKKEGSLGALVSRTLSPS